MDHMQKIINKYRKPHGPNCCYCYDAEQQPNKRVHAELHYTGPVVRECCKCGLSKLGYRLPWKS